MLFNSIDFLIFLPIVFILYWFAFKDNFRNQNRLIVVASYIFYGWWDWRFLSLILFSTIIDFLIGQKLEQAEKKSQRKILLATSLLTNLGLLAFFKYYNFFLDNFIEAFKIMGFSLEARSLNIVLPVGISFYTFQTLSYTIDIYRKKLKATNDFVSFASFVSFFPQLVAGPIERATHLLPQFQRKRSFAYTDAVDGLRQILWGMFKKVVIADNCAIIVNAVFSDPSQHSGSTLFVGAILFAFQIYGDFSGYSDMAIGISRLFGFDLMRNFANPYFSRDIAEFWRRWHISLSTWFRDYLYIPLGGSRGGKLQQIRNTFIIFIVSGFWHGANWTFLIWGTLNAIYFLPLLLQNKNRQNLEVVASNTSLPSVMELFQILRTFFITVLAWIFFRATSVKDAIDYIIFIFTPSFFSMPIIPKLGRSGSSMFFIICFFVIIEWIGRHDQHALKSIGLKWKRYWRLLFYYFLILLIVILAGREQEFIYFQF